LILREAKATFGTEFIVGQEETVTAQQIITPDIPVES
jgi:hypothetical protein